MRSILLVVLAVGLLWLAWRGFGAADQAPLQPESEVGVLLREEGNVLAAEQPAASTEPKTAENKPETPPAASEAVTETKLSNSATPSALEPGMELELARELAHRPRALASWLAAHPSVQESARGKLAQALALALQAQGEAALALARELEGQAAIQASELDALRGLAAGKQGSTLSASMRQLSPLLHAAAIAQSSTQAREDLVGRRHVQAAQNFSDALRAELSAPWPADSALLTEWTEGLRKAQSAHQWSPRGEWPALELSVAAGDSLIAIRKRALNTQPGLITCTGLIARCNGLKNEQAIHPGMKLKIPTEKPHVLVDLDARWMLFFLGETVVASYPVGIGKQGSETPPGQYKVGEKSKEPSWFPPGQDPVPFNDPRNPLGTRWLAWLSEDGAKTHLGFHGTREPESIGKQGSEGCIRLLNSDVEELFELLPSTTPILVQP